MVAQWYSVSPYKPCVLFMGRRLTVQIQIRHRIMRCLIWNFTVCLQNILLKFEKNGNGLLQLIGVGNSIRLKWVRLEMEGSLAQDLLETLCCVLETDTLSSA